MTNTEIVTTPDASSIHVRVTVRSTGETREVVLREGRTYRIDPLNPQKKNQRARASGLNDCNEEHR